MALLPVCCGVCLPVLALLSGCSTLVADRIARQESHDYKWFITDAELAERGFGKGSYCSVQHGLCMSYLHAAPLDQERFSFRMTVNGDPIQLDLVREEEGGARAFSGTVVLLHGFAISKEYMAMTASYFRFLGYQVVVPDMLGHGESEGRVAFGVRDSQLLDELLHHLHGSLTQPLLLFGNSMGALAAAHLASRRDVAGLVLQAPMLPFDTAAFNYVSYGSPLLARLVTERSIRKGALKALEKVPVSREHTDIRPLLTQLTIPILILASPADTVSPYSYFENLQGGNLSVARVEGRSHYSMVVIDQQDHSLILPWLQRQF